jgi:hypothetical protein
MTGAAGLTVQATELPHLPQFTVDWLALPKTFRHIRDRLEFSHEFLKTIL